MPTFDAPNNDIEWCLKLRGDIPFWPDVAEEFPITVYPPTSDDSEHSPRRRNVL